MSPLVRNLRNYAEYHHDTRNLVTHIIGIPMIVLSIEVLLSRPTWILAELPVTPAAIATVLAFLYYCYLDVVWGAVMGIVLVPLLWLGGQIAALGDFVWLASGIGLFVIGWIFQLVGHKFEGRKPAFLDDIKSLMTGPLFVAVEIAFLLGLAKGLQSRLSAD